MALTRAEATALAALLVGAHIELITEPTGLKRRPATRSPMIVLLAAFAVVGLALIAFGSRLGRHGVPRGRPARRRGDRLGRRAARRRHARDRRSPSSAAWVGTPRPVDRPAPRRLRGHDVVDHRRRRRRASSSTPAATSHPTHADLGRLAGLLVLFAGSMLGLVQADHVLVLYTCWELTSITSFLLIGNRHTEPRARAAALHALLVTGAGRPRPARRPRGARPRGRHLPAERDPRPTRRRGPRSPSRWSLVLVGAFTKSAQYPFHAWLPGRHGRADAGQRVPALGDDGQGRRVPRRRASPRRSPTSALWRPLVLTAGCCTLVFGGLRALRQHDLKLLLAFGTVSQLGLLMVLFGAGTPATATAGWVLLVAHAAFKAALFMVVGHHRPPDRHPRHPQHPAAARRVAGRRGRRRAGRRCRWPASRSVPGSSPRSSPTTRWPTAASPARRSCSPSSWPGRCSPSPTRRGSTGGRSSSPRRRAADDAAAPPPCAAAAGRSSRPPAVLAAGGRRARRRPWARSTGWRPPRSPVRRRRADGPPGAVARLRPAARALRA